jgi:hypothetical protein
MVDKELSDFMPKANSDGELVFGEFLSDVSKPLEKKIIIDQLTKINDPELGINIYDLGLIYDIDIHDSNDCQLPCC